VVDDAVLERERAHTRPLAPIGGRVDFAHGRKLAFRPLAATLLTRAPLQLRFAVKIILDALALLVLGERGGEVEVEVAAER
jgi:hypothetical protein